MMDFCAGTFFEVEKASMAQEKLPMTRPGYERLLEDLRRLKQEERPAVIRAIEEARGYGDLSENAEYHAAKERQSFIETRVAELEDRTRRAEVIDVARLTGSSHIKFGATVTLADEDTEEKTIYQIVGADESDIRAGLLSIQSPLARALIGKAKGESVEVVTPGGARAYEILAVAYR